MKAIGILTGGGDCPGLNPVIRGIVRKALHHDIKVIGFRNGWKGVLKADGYELTLESISGILHRGGTILGTSRTNPFKENADQNVASIQATYQKFGLDALIAIGGEDTLGVATKLTQRGLPVVGVPKTIDNDLSSTDVTFGFDTSVNIAMEALDRLHTTAESHSRVIVAEIMGRHAGWLTLYTGLAGGADAIIIPEHPVSFQEVADIIKERHKRKNFSIVAVSEGAVFKDQDMVTKDQELDAFGHVKLGGIGDLLARKLEELIGIESRAVVLGHIQRGGSPSAFDRVLGLRFGVKAVELVMAKEYGKMVSLRGTDVVGVDIEQATGVLKTVNPELYQMATTFFG